jgi:hypothetical protein
MGVLKNQAFWFLKSPALIWNFAPNTQLSTTRKLNFLFFILFLKNSRAIRGHSKNKLSSSLPQVLPCI